MPKINSKIITFVRFAFACNAMAFLIVFLGFFSTLACCGEVSANRLLSNPLIYAVAWLIAPVFCFYFLKRD